MKKTATRKQSKQQTKAPAQARLQTPAKATPSASSAIAQEDLSLAEIKELIELIADRQFTDFELERGKFRLRLGRGATAGTAVETLSAPPLIAPAPAAQAATPVVIVSEPAPLPVASPPAAAPEASPAEKLHTVTSPIVGTFYRAAAPTAAPFVEIGDTVVAEQTVLCIVEAMKLMNEIHSDASGTIAKVFVENGQPVEYGQPLFGVKL